MCYKCGIVKSPESYPLGYDICRKCAKPELDKLRAAQEAFYAEIEEAAAKRGVCRKCNIRKHPTEFYYIKQRAKYDTTCKSCRKEYCKKQRDKNAKPRYRKLPGGGVMQFEP